MNYHKEQLTHIVAVRQRLLEVQRNDLRGKYEANERVSALYPVIATTIMEDMQLNYDAIHVFGIKVDMNFFILMKSGISALVVGLGAAVSRQFFED